MKLRGRGSKPAVDIQWMLQNAVRSSKILTDFRCFTDTAVFGCSTRTVQSQELIIAALVTAGGGLVGAYQEAW